ncbi:phytanoyl-CoA hydroxylase interacting protein-like isoform X2 [Haliotis rufescens]|uniref:phytanoyl-CoA hydroxylase interacting protein-like isoform X2 n=1 Tax=Haliotis rufescens TaxID=6454 RepID=UPI00201FB297|nr:phytanoyl-CoA hydroxylase interacting protein-like isoform X2 [Haliotis rufescens]
MAEGPNAEQAYLAKLLDKAIEHCPGENLEAADVLYRNQPRRFFDHLVNDTMRPYTKDGGGDPRNPMNGNLDGIFFGVTLYNSDLPNVSPFGDTRVKVPLGQVFDEAARLYFGDFYCVTVKRPTHYVILVLTKPDTEADVFCQQHLIRLNERDNTFLKKEGETYETLNQKDMWVEVFYTSEVNISGFELENTELAARKGITGGIPKPPGCNICNVPIHEGQ